MKPEEVWPDLFRRGLFSVARPKGVIEPPAGKAQLYNFAKGQQQRRERERAESEDGTCPSRPFRGVRQTA
jgi:hypothetical protein